MKTSFRFILLTSLITGLMIGGLVALAVLGFRFGPTTTQASSTGLDSTSEILTTIEDEDLEQLLTLMRHSHEQWRTVQLTMISTSNHDGTEHQVVTTYQISADQKGYVYSEGNSGYELWISDGNAWIQERSTDNSYTIFNMTSQQQELLSSFDVPSTPSSITIPHPFGSLIPFPGAELLYSTGIAQSMYHSGEITLLGTDKIADREAAVIQREFWADDGTLIKKHLYWVDTTTGVILQAQLFGSSSLDDWQTQHTVTEISFDVPISNELFNLAPKSNSSHLISPEEFYGLESMTTEELSDD